VEIARWRVVDVVGMEDLVDDVQRVLVERVEHSPDLILPVLQVHVGLLGRWRPPAVIMSD
jgi:hypothetical protein